MRDASGTLWRVLHEASSLVVVIYPHSEHREDLLEQIELLAPDPAKVRRTSDVADAFGEPDAVLLLTPDDEPAAVATLEGRRDALLTRQAPVVLFLLRGGEATRLLRAPEAAGLMSWLGGRIIDPEALDKVDAVGSRAQFTAATGMSPEEWLRRWRGGLLDDTLAHHLLFHQAALTEEEREEGP